jgi:hypothetical protein
MKTNPAIAAERLDQVLPGTSFFGDVNDSRRFAIKAIDDGGAPFVVPRCRIGK